jgi:predicted nucleotide-binding protein
MARSPRIPPESEPKRWTLKDIDAGIKKLNRRIEEVRKLDPNKMRHDDAAVDAATRNIKADIAEIFSKQSQEYLTHGAHSVGYPEGYGGLDDHHYQEFFRRGLPKTISMLEGLIQRLEEKRDDLAGAGPSPRIRSEPTLSRRVFVVHGHDEAVKQTVARTLERLDLEPIILHELPDRGRTVIEKLEAETDVAFAVVLMTADDLGGPKTTPPGSYRPRTRQNVLVELGLFLGKLGRSRVSVLFEPDVEMPSDYAGVLYTQLDAAGAWQFKLAKEIHAAGIEVDLNKLL